METDEHDEAAVSAEQHADGERQPVNRSVISRAEIDAVPVSSFNRARGRWIVPLHAFKKLFGETVERLAPVVDEKRADSHFLQLRNVDEFPPSGHRGGLNIAVRCEASAAVKAAVRAGMGVGILYRNAVARRLTLM
jgi:DNA-binding transcriptional LysR family regulator